MDLTWANIAAIANESPASQPLQYSIRNAGAKRGRLAQPLKPRVVCNGVHCTAIQGYCPQYACQDKLQSRLVQTKEDVKALSAGFPARLKTLTEVRDQIHETCKTDTFLSTEMEDLRKAVNRVMKLRVEPSFCECTSCLLETARKEREMWQTRVDAVQKRTTALREFRLANDKETLARTSYSFSNMKFFTPVGSAKAKGVTALRPTLQLQSSYNVTALITNSMATKPLKLMEGKPKSLRIVNTVSAAKGSAKATK